MNTKVALSIAAGLGAMAGYAFGEIPHGDPYTPLGSLDVDAKLVQTGSRPSLKWNIEFPRTAKDFVSLTAEDRLVAHVATRVEMRVVGMGLQSDAADLPAALWSNVDGSNWKKLVYGSGEDVGPPQVGFDGVVSAGQTIDLAARGRKEDGNWYDIRWTTQLDPGVTGLHSGDPVPDAAPAFQQGDVEDYLTSYVTDDARISLGPNDVLYLFELTSETPGESDFDLQDLAVVNTFSEP